MTTSSQQPRTAINITLATLIMFMRTWNQFFCQWPTHTPGGTVIIFQGELMEQFYKDLHSMPWNYFLGGSDGTKFYYSWIQRFAFCGPWLFRGKLMEKKFYNSWIQRFVFHGWCGLIVLAHLSVCHKPEKTPLVNNNETGGEASNVSIYLQHYSCCDNIWTPNDHYITIFTENILRVKKPLIGDKKGT